MFGEVCWSETCDYAKNRICHWRGRWWCFKVANRENRKILTLTIKKKWFDLIKSGEKKIEYRSYKPYWIKRIVDKEYDVIDFRNGYRSDSPRVITKYEGYGISEGECNPLGENKVFTIHIGDIINEEE